MSRFGLHQTVEIVLRAVATVAGERLRPLLSPRLDFFDSLSPRIAPWIMI